MATYVKPKILLMKQPILKKYCVDVNELYLITGEGMELINRGFELSLNIFKFGLVNFSYIYHL
jgi:hypothetical protein